MASQDVDFDEDSFANRIPQSITTPKVHTDERQSVLDFLQALTNPGDKPESQSHGVTSIDQQAPMTIEPLSQAEPQQPESPLETQVPLRRSTRERVPLPQSFKLRSALFTRVLNSIELALYNNALKH